MWSKSPVVRLGPLRPFTPPMPWQPLQLLGALNIESPAATIAAVTPGGSIRPAGVAIAAAAGDAAAAARGTRAARVMATRRMAGLAGVERKWATRIRPADESVGSMLRAVPDRRPAPRRAVRW